MGEGSGLGALTLPIPASLRLLTVLQLSAAGEAHCVKSCQLPYPLPVEGFQLGGFSAKARGNPKNYLKLIWMPKGDPYQQSCSSAVTQGIKLESLMSVKSFVRRVTCC